MQVYLSVAMSAARNQEGGWKLKVEAILCKRGAKTELFSSRAVLSCPILSLQLKRMIYTYSYFIVRCQYTAGTPSNAGELRRNCWCSSSALQNYPYTRFDPPTYYGSRHWRYEPFPTHDTVPSGLQQSFLLRVHSPQRGMQLEVGSIHIFPLHSLRQLSANWSQ